MNYKVYHGIENNKPYVAVSAEIYPDEALKIANKHFKLNKFCLKIEAGYAIGNDLYLGFPDTKSRKAKPVWVVTKR